MAQAKAVRLYWVFIKNATVKKEILKITDWTIVVKDQKNKSENLFDYIGNEN